MTTPIPAAEAAEAPEAELSVRVGGRITHSSHGEGRIEAFDEVRGLVTVAFRDETSAQYTATWRRLLDPATRGAVLRGAGIGAMVIKVPLAKLRADAARPDDERNPRTWTVPGEVDYAAERVRLLAGIAAHELTVDEEDLESKVWWDDFSRQVRQAQYVDRADLDDVIEAIVFAADWSTGKYIRGQENRPSVGLRVEEYVSATGRLGDDLWRSVVCRGEVAPRIRSELDRTLLAAVLLTTADVHDEDALRAGAEALCEAVERRVAERFGPLIDLRRRAATKIIQSGEWRDNRRRTPYSFDLGEVERLEGDAS